jgi:hypothetical protein
MTVKPFQPQEKYVVRMPDGLRDRIRAAADANNRSMNAEIVHRLETSLAVDEHANDATGGYWELPDGLSDSDLSRIIEAANKKAIALALREAGIVRRPLLVGGKSSSSKSDE